MPTSITVSLWPDRPRPVMRVVFPGGPAEPARPSGPRPAVVVLRGGGYAFSNGSGAGAAEWAAAHGLVGVEVEYGTRATGDFFPQNHADAARAMRLVRARAAEWSVDPARVALLGFSAGGHLASLLSTQPSLLADARDDLAARCSARPDLVALAYPVISFLEGYHPGAYASSVDNFLGYAGADLATRRRFSSELHVTPDHPPVFLWTTRDDDIVPYTHSTRFAEACERAGVPISFTLYDSGPHGMGLALEAPPPVRGWSDELLAWLDARWGKRGKHG